MKTVFTVIVGILWVFMAFAPSFGLELQGDILPPSVVFAGLTIALAILLHSNTGKV